MRLAIGLVTQPLADNGTKITMAECWLYLYENRAERSLYIGIADSMERVFAPHNKDAERLRDSPGSEILQTLKPFSSRADARKAEAIAIHVATLAGVRVTAETDTGETVTVANDTGSIMTYTNRAGTISSSELGPAILVREGTLDVSTFAGTVFIPITANEIDGRPGPFGGRRGAVFADRTSKYWNIAKAKRPSIKRAIAVLVGGRNIVLGDWDVEPTDSWAPSEYGGTRIAIPLSTPEKDDPRGIKGMQITGHRLNSGPTYSADLRWCTAEV